MIELRQRQVDFLKVLATSRGAVSKALLCEKTGAHPTNVFANAMGYLGLESRLQRDKEAGYPSLLTLRFAETISVDVHGDGTQIETCYRITPLGRDALRQVQQSIESGQ